MYILMVILLAKQVPVEIKTQEFESSITCIKAIHQLIALENKSLQVKAFCTKK